MYFLGHYIQWTRGLGTQGPGTRGPRDQDLNWHTLYVYIHSTYLVHNYIVHVSLIARLECTMEQTKFGTFVLAAFVPFRSNGVD